MIARGLGFLVLLGLAVGCGAPAPTNANEGDVASSSSDLSARGGEALFEHATFGGNGRTCSTCHSERTAGTISPDVVQARYAANPDDPLFRSLDSDDGQGADYARLKTDATIRITLPLPPWLSLKDDPTARTITYNRGVPTVFNTPALDPVLMQDGRAPDLLAQAADAINTHYQPTEQPSRTQLKQIAAYEKTLFSSWQLMLASWTGIQPKLPPGHGSSAIRGRRFFVADGLCGMCHGGPMLNAMTSASPFGQPGDRFTSVLVSEMNEGNQPVHTYIVDSPDGPFEFTSTDLGRVLITQDPNDVNEFKIPTLWGVRNTAPYFHDNSAKTLEAVVEHYATLFEEQGVATLTEQDKADIVAYMKQL